MAGGLQLLRGAVRGRIAVRVGEADLVGELAIAEHEVDAGVAPDAIEIAAAVRSL